VQTLRQSVFGILAVSVFPAVMHNEVEAATAFPLVRRCFVGGLTAFLQQCVERGVLDRHCDRMVIRLQTIEVSLPFQKLVIRRNL